MSASFGLGRFREINTSKTFLRRYRAAETAEATTFRGRPHGGRLKARLAHQRFIFLNASVSASIIAHCLIQRNKIFILLRWERELRSVRKIAGCYSVISDTGYFGVSSLFLCGSFAPTDRFENLEIRKGFLQFSNLNLEQNPSLTTLAIESEVPLIKILNQESVLDNNSALIK